MPRPDAHHLACPPVARSPWAQKQMTHSLSMARRRWRGARAASSLTDQHEVSPQVFASLVLWAQPILLFDVLSLQALLRAAASAAHLSAALLGALRAGNLSNPAKGNALSALRSNTTSSDLSD